MITLENVSKSYAKGQPALNDVSLHIDKGEFRIYSRKQRFREIYADQITVEGTGTDFRNNHC